MKYSVRMPFAGFVDVEVEADNKESALEAFEDLQISKFSDPCVEWVEWDFYEHISRGNMSCVTCSDVDIQELK